LGLARGTIRFLTMTDGGCPNPAPSHGMTVSPAETRPPPPVQRSFSGRIGTLQKVSAAIPFSPKIRSS
jgi:hypothetical protein